MNLLPGGTGTVVHLTNGQADAPGMDPQETGGVVFVQHIGTFGASENYY